MVATRRQFTKIKFDGSRVRLEYQMTRPGGADPDEFTLLCSDRPEAAFVDALQGLAEDVVTICELGATDATKLKVRGVTLTWTNDVMGACITALKALKTANAPLVLNTPHLPVTPYGEGDESSPVLPESTAFRLEVLADFAERYLNGERAQGSLFPKSATDEDAPGTTNAGREGQGSTDDAHASPASSSRGL